MCVPSPVRLFTLYKPNVSNLFSKWFEDVIGAWFCPKMRVVTHKLTQIYRKSVGLLKLESSRYMFLATVFDDCSYIKGQLYL